MNRLLFIFSVALLTLCSCFDNKSKDTVTVVADSVAVGDSLPTDTLEEIIAETPMPVAADELFDDFIFNFAANRKLQMKRIHFPLDVQTGERHEKLDKSAWKMENFFMHQGYYTLLFNDEKQMELGQDTSVSRGIIEKIYFSDHRVKQYYFARERGSWMLQRIVNKSIDEMPDASFLTFYHQFSTDSVFQVGSLSSTVQFTGPDPDDDFSEMEGVITPDTWPAFAPELPTDMIYNIVYGEEQKGDNVKIFVIRGIANGFEVELTFKRQGDKWKLTKLST
ncbi:MAG: DUF4348 domain-containing protein [Prevotella sp.]|nr:DUF4348 domain-containing protein [Prevotella sp.]